MRLKANQPPIGPAPDRGYPFAAAAVLTPRHWCQQDQLEPLMFRVAKLHELKDGIPGKDMLRALRRILSPRITWEHVDAAAQRYQVASRSTLRAASSTVSRSECSKLWASLPAMEPRSLYDCDQLLWGPFPASGPLDRYTQLQAEIDKRGAGEPCATFADWFERADTQDTVLPHERAIATVNAQPGLF